MNDRDLARAAARLSAGHATDICVSSSKVHHLRYGGGEIVLDQTIERRSVTVRTLVEGRLGIVHSERCDPQGLALAVQRAVALARAKRGPTEREALPDPSPLDHQDDRDTALARWADEGKVAAVVEQLKRAKGAGVTLAGSVSSGCFSRTILSGHGAILSEEGSIAKAQFISQTDKASGYAAGFSNDLAGLGFERLCGESIDKARRADKRVELDIGRYDVVLEPPAVSELLEWMTGIAFTARSAEDGTSFVAGRKGEAVTGAAISLFDDASRPFGLGLGSHFDGEGQVPQRVRFVTEGRAGEVVQSAASGARNGCGSTGHSDGAGGEQVNHLHMLGGDASIEQLVSRLDRGIWVNRFHYVNGLLDPPKATMTGLTRDGCLYVEKGEVVGGFAPMRFTDSILEAFSRCDGVTEQLTAVASQWRDGGSLVVPALLIRGFPFTSKQKAIS